MVVAAVGPGGVFRSSCIAKYVISGPVVPIYEAGFLSRAIVPIARTYTSKYAISALARRPDEPLGDEKRSRSRPRKYSYENPIRPNDTEGTIVECTTDRENQEV